MMSRNDITFRGENSYSLLVLLAVVILSLPSSTTAQEARRFTVRDSIEIVTPTSGVTAETNKPQFSPEGRYFFVLTRRGLLTANEVESAIWLFDTAAVKRFLEDASGARAPKPRRLVRMGASSNYDPITNVRWGVDAQSIAFLGRDADNVQHLFIADITSGKLHQLSPKGVDVVEFDRAKGVSVFTTVPSVSDSQVYQTAGSEFSDIVIATGKPILNLLFPNWQREDPNGVVSRQLWRSRDGQPAVALRGADGAPVSLRRRSLESFLSLSPNGRYLVAMSLVSQVPPEWAAYEPLFPELKFVADALNASPLPPEKRPGQYVLIDLQSGEVAPLLDAPAGLAGGYYNVDLQAVWSPDGQRVAVTNTFMPFDKSKPQSGLTRPCVAVVETATRKVDCVQETAKVAADKVRASPWLSKIEWRGTEELVFSYRPQGSELPARLFKRNSGHWEPAGEVPAKTAVERTVSVTFREGVNEPAVLMAKDPATGITKQLWDLNPQLSAINLGEASVYNWEDKEKRQWTGGLVKPPGFAHGRRYPFVIQTHGFNPNKFLADGPWHGTMAHAARALAGRGIVVLQVNDHRIDGFGTPREAERVRDGYETAIAQLASDGVIDPENVAITGYSRTGWWVMESLIHAPKRYRAAILAEVTSLSLGEYLMNADFGGPYRAQELARLIGGEPFGEGLNKWIEHSPGFNVDKIKAPVFFQMNSPVALVYGWDLYATFRMQKKPIELLYIRNGGSHYLTKPLELLASQEMAVDWYDFWLNRHEDPDPAKSEQYKRWRELRKLQDGQTESEKSNEPGD